MVPGKYRTITGVEAMALGLAAAAACSGLKITYCSYPITPASGILHGLAKFRGKGVVTFQAEDEIAAVCAAIGASFAGSLGITSSSGPGIALKGEAIGLAISVELPLIVVNSQRAGPSTGMPTKTEQSDLYQSVYGRNADSPLVVLAASSSANCFDMAIEAVRLATKYMTPVMLLSDGYMGNASEPWLIPDFDSFEPFPVTFASRDEASEEAYLPYVRDAETLRRIVRDRVEAQPLAAPDYISLADAETLEELDGELRGDALLSLAVRVGTTRLIDNVTLRP